MLNIPGNLKLFAMLFCNLISNTLMVSKFRIPTISPLKFSALVWPLAPGPRILLQLAPAGYLWCDQSWLQCCRCRKSLFLTFCKNCNNNEMTESGNNQCSHNLQNFHIVETWNSQMFRSFLQSFPPTISLTAFTCFDQMLEPALESALIMRFFTCQHQFII